jgi:hypothetical protein
LSPFWRGALAASGFIVGLAIVGLLAVIAYAMLSSDDSDSGAEVGRLTQTATPRPSPTARPTATPTPPATTPPTATPEPTPEVTPEPTQEPPPPAPVVQEPVVPVVEEQPPPAQEEPPPQPPTVAASCPDVIPGTYVGSVVIDGVVAPAGTLVVARVGDKDWATTQVSNGTYVFDVPEVEYQYAGCFAGGIVSFLVDGRFANESIEWRSGLHDLDLTVGAIAAPSPTQSTSAIACQAWMDAGAPADDTEGFLACTAWAAEVCNAWLLDPSVVGGAEACALVEMLAGSTQPVGQGSPDLARCINWLAGFSSLEITGRSACRSAESEAEMAGNWDLGRCIKWLAGFSSLEITGRSACRQAADDAAMQRNYDLHDCLRWLAGLSSLEVTGRSGCRQVASY